MLKGTHVVWLFLGGSWAVKRKGERKKKITTLITHITGLITLLITTHEPPSWVYGLPPERLLRF